MNLENLNVTELNAHEMVAIDGGKSWRQRLFEIGMEIAAALLEDPEKSGISSGHDSTMYGHWGGARP